MYFSLYVLQTKIRQIQTWHWNYRNSRYCDPQEENTRPSNSCPCVLRSCRQEIYVVSPSLSNSHKLLSKSSDIQHPEQTINSLFLFWHPHKSKHSRLKILPVTHSIVFSLLFRSPRSSTGTTLARSKALALLVSPLIHSPTFPLTSNSDKIHSKV